MNEIDKFFEGLPEADKKVIDILPSESTNSKPESTPEQGSTPEFEPKGNRRERRLEQQLQRERESAIALNERVKALSEMVRIPQGDGEIDPRLLRVFGDSDAGKTVARDFSQILMEERNTAKALALQELEERQHQLAQEQKKYESLIDQNLEMLEDKHNIDLTSDAPKARKARNEFLSLVEKLSPKDQDGNPTAYADFDSTFEIYRSTQDQSRQSETINRQKEIASRSMQRSESTSPQAMDDATERWLNQNGIRTRN